MSSAQSTPVLVKAAIRWTPDLIAQSDDTNDQHLFCLQESYPQLKGKISAWLW
ncbi:MAG: hypothetical protein M3036_02675 [Bifidobacteriales bacterium]|nr:hypothetical protein [Bifidobacteriales bacterium]